MRSCIALLYREFCVAGEREDVPKVLLQMHAPRVPRA